MKTMKKILVWVLCIAMLIPLFTTFVSSEAAVASDVANKALAYRRPNNGSTAQTDVTLTSGLPSHISKATFSVKVDKASSNGIVVDFKDGDVSRLVFTYSSEAGKIKLYRDAVSPDQWVMDLNVSTWYCF